METENLSPQNFHILLHKLTIMENGIKMFIPNQHMRAHNRKWGKMLWLKTFGAIGTRLS